MQPEYPSQPQQPYAPVNRRSGMPVWGWVLIGCGGAGCFTVLILPALLYPVFAQARERAREASCLSNVRQLCLAMSMYTQDYDDRLPRGAAWHDETLPYVQSENVYHCPSARARDAMDASIYGYAFYSGVGEKVTKEIANPNTTLLIYDSSISTKNAADAGTSLPSPGRHIGSNNIGYVDGHARRSDGIAAGVIP